MCGYVYTSLFLCPSVHLECIPQIPLLTGAGSAVIIYVIPFSREGAIGTSVGFSSTDGRYNLSVHGLVDWTGNRAGSDGGNLNLWSPRVSSKPIAWHADNALLCSPPPAKRKKQKTATPRRYCSTKAGPTTRPLRRGYSNYVPDIKCSLLVFLRHNTGDACVCAPHRRGGERRCIWPDSLLKSERAQQFPSERTSFATLLYRWFLCFSLDYWTLCSRPLALPAARVVLKYK